MCQPLILQLYQQFSFGNNDDDDDDDDDNGVNDIPHLVISKAKWTDIGEVSKQ